MDVRAIRKAARQDYDRSGRAMACAVCGYSRHVEVAHLIPIAEFSDDDLIVTINTLTNLAALCPNHHWEHDHGMLSAEELLAVGETSEEFP